jgi:hypothetical protein
VNIIPKNTWFFWIDTMMNRTYNINNKEAQ